MLLVVKKIHTNDDAVEHRQNWHNRFSSEHGPNNSSGQSTAKLSEQGVLRYRCEKGSSIFLFDPTDVHQNISQLCYELS
jgi:hypothetical protein